MKTKIALLTVTVMVAVGSLLVVGLLAKDKPAEVKQPVVRPAEWAQPVLQPKLKNFHRLTDKLYRSSQPDDDEMEALEAAGITDILNLRDHHSDKDEAEDTNLRLHRIKMEADDITMAQVRQAMTIIRDAKGPVVVHCWHGSDRTGCVCAFYRMTFQGWSKPEAIRELRQGGYGFHEMFDEIITLINDADVAALREQLGVKRP